MHANCLSFICYTCVKFLMLFLFSAVRENRTRGGRNKFGPIYRRDRALRRQLQMQRLHSEGVVPARSYLNDKLYIHDFASLSHDADVKPTAASLASLATQNPSLPRDSEFMWTRRQLWRDKHDVAGRYSARKDLTQLSFPLFERQTGSEMITAAQQQSIDDMAATAAADPFGRHFATDEHQTSQLGFFRHQQTYQPAAGHAWQYPSAPGASHSVIPQPGCESTVPVSANFSPGFSQDGCSEFPRKLSGETCEMPERCHYPQVTVGSGHRPLHSSSNVTVSQCHTGVSLEHGLRAYHNRHRRHHPQYSYYHRQQHRPGQVQPQLTGSLPQHADVKQLQADEHVSSHSSDAASPEFITEADIAAQRLPGALKLINDLQRHDTRLRDSITQLCCYADEMLEQLQTSVMDRSKDETSLEVDSTALTRQMIVMACQLCDQALFVLVEWARHAHFFRQLPVSDRWLKTHIVPCLIV